MDATEAARDQQRAQDARDDRVEQLLGNLLRWGVLIAAAIVALGGVLYLAHHAGTPVDNHVFRGESSELRSLGSIYAGALQLHPAAVIQLGLVCLIATPILRVAFSLVAFALERDRLYVLITAIVLGLLMFSLLGGHAAL